MDRGAGFRGYGTGCRVVGYRSVASSAKGLTERGAGHLPGVTIAVMGCIVNGPGEMADADFGYVGGEIEKKKKEAETNRHTNTDTHKTDTHKRHKESQRWRWRRRLAI